MWIETLPNQNEYDTIIYNFECDINEQFSSPYCVSQLYDKISFSHINNAQLLTDGEIICFGKYKFVINEFVPTVDKCVRLFALVDNVLMNHPKLNVIERKNRRSWRCSEILGNANEECFDIIKIKIISSNDHMKLLKHNCTKREIHTWAICAKRMGICQDLRLLISKLLFSQT